MKKILFLFLGLSLLSSCVSKKKFIDLQGERDSIRMSLSKLEEDLKACERSKTSFRTDLEMRGNQLSAREAELAAERSRGGPPMSMFSIASASAQPGLAMVWVNG